MMKEKDFEWLSNAEINIRLKEMENDYEITKKKINDLIDHLNELDESYINGNKVLERRTKRKTV